MKITYYGHSCFAAEITGKHLLFDPFIIQNPLAKAVDIKKIKADYIFVSHAHFDHMADAIAIANQTGATVVSNYEIVTWLAKNGVKNGSSGKFVLFIALTDMPTVCGKALWRVMAVALTGNWNGPSRRGASR